jgi:GNAT superfamily N-acetyltransferase
MQEMVATKPVVRPALISDFEKILALIEVFPHQDHRQDKDKLHSVFAEILADKRLNMLVAECEGQLVSTCTLAIIPNLTRRGRQYGLIEVVATLAPFRRRGFGSAVLNAALETAWRQNCYKVMLQSGKLNLQAHEFYKAIGFVDSKLGFSAEPPVSDL